MIKIIKAIVFSTLVAEALIAREGEKILKKKYGSFWDFPFHWKLDYLLSKFLQFLLWPVIKVLQWWVLK